MSCSSCSTGGGCSTNGKTGGCRSNGGCSTGGCNKMNVYDWLSKCLQVATTLDELA